MQIHHREAARPPAPDAAWDGLGSQLHGSAMLGRGLFRGVVAQAHCCRLTPTLRVAGCGQAVPTLRTLHCSAHLRGPEHDDFAPISKAVPDTDILAQIEEVRQRRGDM